MKAPKNLIIAIVATAIVAGGVGYYAGLSVGKSQSLFRGANGQFGGNNANRPGGAAVNRLRNGGGFVNGEILSRDDKSITVKDRTGGSKIIFFAPSTTIGKTTDGVQADLVAGETVMVSGTANSDGSVTAQSIQIRPAGAPGFNGPGGPNGAMPINGGNVPVPTDGQPNNK